MILDVDGHEVYRNPAAERYREARHSDAVVAAGLDALVSRALQRRACEREQQVFGPPRAVVHLSAVPIGSPERPLGCRGVRRRRVGDAPDRERAARLRGQRESRAQDPDRRARGAGRDAGRRGRSRGHPPTRRADGKGGRAPGAHRRRPARPQPDRNAGSAFTVAGAAGAVGRRRRRPTASGRRSRGHQPAGASRRHGRAGRPASGDRWSVRSPTSSTTR